MSADGQGGCKFIRAQRGDIRHHQNVPCGPLLPNPLQTGTARQSPDLGNLDPVGTWCRGPLTAATSSLEPWNVQGQGPGLHHPSQTLAGCPVLQRLFPPWNRRVKHILRAANGIMDL